MRASKHPALLIGLATLLVAVLAVILFRVNPPPTIKPVRIGYLPIYVDLPLFVAKEKGFFQQRGVRVELVRFASSPDIGTALTTGDIQFGASIAYSVALSNESRDPGKLRIFIVDSETPENYLSSIVVPRHSPIRSIEDLKGKKIGSFPGPTAMTFCKLVLEKHGLTAGTNVDVVELEVASHLSALEAGTVDALFTYEPTATQAVIEKGATKLLAGAVEKEVINPWQAGVWVVSTQFRTASPTQARSVMLALYDAIDYIRNDPADAKICLTSYTSIKPNVAAATPNIPFAKLAEVDRTAFQKHADILLSRKIISKPIDTGSLLIPPEWIATK